MTRDTHAGKTVKGWEIGLVALVAVLTVLCCWLQPLYSLDKAITDAFYRSFYAPDARIKILAIDEKTLGAYGNPQSWDREIYDRLIRTLNGADAPGPVLVAIDVLMTSEKNGETDAAFAATCTEYGNVVTAANLLYKDKLTAGKDGSIVLQTNVVDQVEMPYPALAGATVSGFANAMIDGRDNYVRCAKLSERFGEQVVDSFDLAIYKLYCEKSGLTPTLPKTSADGTFVVEYAGRSGTFEVISMADILDGTVDPRACSGAIVFVGAYASGLQDAYNVPAQRGALMYGVEIHANIFSALLTGRTALPAQQWTYGLIAAAIVAAFWWFGKKLKPVYAAIVLAAAIGVTVAVSRLLAAGGIVTDILYIPIWLIVGYAYILIRGFLTERRRRQEVVSAFKQYVAPQVVEEISKSGSFELNLGGQTRAVAVLFVDIRGFTPLSESLPPERVVSILNECLAQTTKAIFQNGGTLDKFIGDATMALFNAPIDLEDYVFKAVCTAVDIRAGIASIQNELQEKYGKIVNVGIGVNCGNAVIGNIGCDFRMDYTAIGDTVNTAARLESNAKPGQILISEQVYEPLKDRLMVTPVGEIPLKGKSQSVFVYQVDEVLRN